MWGRGAKTLLILLTLLKLLIFFTLLILLMSLKQSGRRRGISKTQSLNPFKRYIQKFQVVQQICRKKENRTKKWYFDLQPSPNNFEIKVTSKTRHADEGGGG